MSLGKESVRQRKNTMIPSCPVLGKTFEAFYSTISMERQKQQKVFYFFKLIFQKHYKNLCK